MYYFIVYQIQHSDIIFKMVSEFRKDSGIWCLGLCEVGVGGSKSTSDAVGPMRPWGFVVHFPLRALGRKCSL